MEWSIDCSIFFVLAVAELDCCYPRLLPSSPVIPTAKIIHKTLNSKFFLVFNCFLTLVLKVLICLHFGFKFIIFPDVNNKELVIWQ
jgi:hypothetical protein